MAKRSFKCFVEEKLGKLPSFVIFAVLEWILILVLFIDGFLAYFANEFAKFFELQIPCLLCTRIDHVLVHRDADFYYNDSICEAHKKDVSSLAYCHVHKKLSAIRKICDGCLLSFATEKESDCDTYKSLVGFLDKDIDLFVDDDREIHLTLPVAGRKGEAVMPQKNRVHKCSCCGEALKVKSYSREKSSGLVASHAPASSPRAPFAPLRNEENRSTELPHIRYTELKLSDRDSHIQDDEDGLKTPQLRPLSIRENAKAVSVPLLESEDLNEDRTPTLLAKGNRFFGIPLSDSPISSPRWVTRLPRKSPLYKSELASESAEVNASIDTDADVILHHLKRQVRLDRKSLMALYMELDEERSASAVAANNAMAMITRLQAEKAAVHMEALQYQRMMEEQAEYDQEALQAMHDMLVKREEDVKVLEAHLEAYRNKYGVLEEAYFSLASDSVGKVDEDYSESKSHSPSSCFERSEIVSLTYGSTEGFITRDNMPNEEEPSSSWDCRGEADVEKPKQTFPGRRGRFLGRLKHLDMMLQLPVENSAQSMESSTENVNHKEEEIEQDNKDYLTKQLSHFYELIKSIRVDNEISQHDSDTHENRRERRKLLTEISESLQMLHHIVKLPFEEDYDE